MLRSAGVQLLVAVSLLHGCALQPMSPDGSRACEEGQVEVGWGEERFYEVAELRVEEEGSRALAAFVAESFTRTPAREPIRLSPSLYGNGWFYRAEGSFHAFNTCNTWIARAMENVGPQCDDAR